MTQLRILAFLTFYYVLFIALAHAYPAPAVVTQPKVNSTQLSAFTIAFNDSHVFEIPPGIFTTYDMPLADAPFNSERFDYIPYRSDEYDSVSWALIKQILASTTKQATQQNNAIKAAKANGGYLAEDTENVIFSPFSIKLVLALLTEATGNGTRSQQQLLTALGGATSLQNLRTFYRNTLVALQHEQTGEYTLHLDTRFFTDTAVQPLPEYTAVLQSVYQTPVEQLEFADSTTSADKMNSWIARVTEGRLKELVSAESVANSVMLLVNAIYFNGKWLRKFSETPAGAFYRTPTDQLKVNYMELTDNFFYYHCNELKAKVIALPYRGGKFSMFVALPNEGQHVDVLLQRMQSEQFKHIEWPTERSKVRVVMPKFKFAHKTDLKAVLCRMGVVDIFTDDADLSGMTASAAKQLSVSNILQKSGIDVNEVGTVAYAATEVEIVNRFGADEEEFIVNRPFVFFIEEASTGTILFAGKVLNPMS
ncbi:serine protease inhibitor 27A [Ceratitis capitata]|uniref:(Mediterranean fruit fly) hypothetical protein n=1 Tax=Ceratitis capitata TaxID=7213 RepID=A0A811UFD2_CERCA|nr:serine protease inhibitor 27A [Ceratitis capitata]CAD6996597.1 unnamed protein product [Ceratitis capitata]